MTKPLTVLGVDPDVKNTAFALVTEQKVLQVGIVKPTKGITEEKSSIKMIHALAAPMEMMVRKADVVVVEGQQIYTGRHAAKPDSILALSYVTGGLIAYAVSESPDTPVWIPRPALWKGQVPKHIHQARSYSHYGMKFSQGKDYAWPSGCAVAAAVTGFQKTNKSDWKHLGDAIGLALWGCKHYEQTKSLR